MVDEFSLSFEGHMPIDLALSYRMLPFSVPGNTSRIGISYHCESDLSFGLEPDENPHDYVADIALFDPRGAEFMGEGYRGSSGNSRDTLFIGTDDATPGYTPGELYAGEWQIMLGFYKIAPSGCDYHVTVHLTPGNAHPTSDLPARLPLRTTAAQPANATGWYKGDLHCHTFHSDGTPDPREVIREAERLGLDFLAITDHNTFTQQIIMNQTETSLMLIPGCEVTTLHGHWNIWGEGGWIDFRVNDEHQMETTIREAVRQGYLTSCNHPRPNGPPWKFPEVEGYECVEAWNGLWEDMNTVCLSFWETRINAGERLVAVGGSDCHQLHTPGEGPLAQPTTYVYVEGAPSPAAVIGGLRAGHAFITRAPNGPQLYLSSGSAMMGDVVEIPAVGILKINVHIVDGDGMQFELWTAQGVEAKHAITANDVTLDFETNVRSARYVRAQLRDIETQNVTALTNPIYVRSHSEQKALSALSETDGKR